MKMPGRQQNLQKEVIVAIAKARGTLKDIKDIIAKAYDDSHIRKLITQVRVNKDKNCKILLRFSTGFSY